MVRFKLLRISLPPLLLIALLAFNVTAWSQSRESQPPKTQSPVPVGAEKAVKAALAASPGAVVEQVATPSKSMGIGGPDDALWTIQMRNGDGRRTLTVSGGGVLVRASKSVETKDLPSMVSNGLAKVAPDGAAKITKLQTLGIVRYVPLSTPEVQYSARVVDGAQTLSVAIAPDGTVLQTKPARPLAAANPKAPKEDGPIPEQAAKAVNAVREIFPKMVFDLVEEVPYIDSTTQTTVMLWYEVEFFLDGVQHQVDATPDGLVIAYRKVVPANEIPKAVAEAAGQGGSRRTGRIVQRVGDGRGAPVRRTRASGDRVRDSAARGKADSPLAFKLRTDGTEVKEPELPEWAKAKSKKENNEGK